MPPVQLDPAASAAAVVNPAAADSSAARGSHARSAGARRRSSSAGEMSSAKYSRGCSEAAPGQRSPLGRWHQSVLVRRPAQSVSCRP